MYGALSASGKVYASDVSGDEAASYVADSAVDSCEEGCGADSESAEVVVVSEDCSDGVVGEFDGAS